MSEDAKHEADETPSADEDRAAILERRNRFIRVAMAGLAGASIVAACGGDVDDQGSTPDGGVAQQSDATPQACLKMAVEASADVAVEEDAGPNPVDAAPDAATEAGKDAAKDAVNDDAAPLPCLSPPIDDAG